MAETTPQFEQVDNAGRTENFSGTATTSPVNVPAVANEKISGYLVVAQDKNLQVSDDGGTTYFTFDDGDAMAWDVKGEITQIQVKTSSGTADYKIKINFEEF